MNVSPGTRQEDLKAKLASLNATLAWAIKSQSAPRIKAMIEMARSEPGMSIMPEDFDKDPFLFNTINGTLELKTGKLREHRREDYITKLCRVPYDPDAKCPLFEKFLDRITDGNRDLIQYLQRGAGYSLTGDVREQCLFFLHGDGANGKSTFLSAMLNVMGDYGMQSVAELLMVRGGESHPTERADLFGKRFVATVETEDGKRMAEALMKTLTGGDKIRARRMREDFWEFSPTHKIWLAANHKPNIRGTDHAIWRRIKLIPFTVTISEAEKDPDLARKLAAEAPGILAWMVRGFTAWQAHGLGEPEQVRKATDAYRNEQDTVAAFIGECCVVGPDFRCKSSTIYDRFKSWCASAGEREISQKKLGTELGKRGFQSYPSNGICYRGIALNVLDDGNQTNGTMEPLESNPG